MRRSILAGVCVVAGATIGLTAAPASAAKDPLAKVRVSTPADATVKPTITFHAPISVKKTKSRVVTAGAGETLTRGTRVVFHHAIENGRTGKELVSSFGTISQSAVLDKQQTNAALVKSLLGTKVGAEVLIAMSPHDAKAIYPALLQAKVSVRVGDTLLFLVKVDETRTALARATGSPVAPRPDLPAVTLAADGKPSVTAQTAAAPTQLVAQSLIAGMGAVVQAGQQITAHYSGWIWSSGKQFDSSWDRGRPVDFSIGVGTVIKGWDEGLVGVPVGSQVLLIIPPDEGYGASGNSQAGISGTDTLVFVVDILDAY